MTYVIRRADQGGGWVADQRKRAGGSYTWRLQDARVFATKEEAERERCPGNEGIQTVEEALA